MRRKNKRGMEMTVGTIVAMAAALVLLAVLLFITYKYVLKPGNNAGNLGTCAGQGGVCKDGCESSERTLVGMGCPDTNQPKSSIFCCLKKT